MGYPTDALVVAVCWGLCIGEIQRREHREGCSVDARCSVLTGGNTEYGDGGDKDHGVRG